jgi:(S)-sulfolactate dehydrogenase
MSDVVITEFMDDAAIREGLAGFDVLYDPGLVDRSDELIRVISDARALIVRNRTQVRGQLLDAGRGHVHSARDCRAPGHGCKRPFCR